MAKVLILEDQPSVSTVVQYHVEQAGFETTSSTDVEDAWKKLITEAPDAAIVDIKLPGADGWTFIERVRGDGRYSGLPIVVLTGLLEASVVSKAEKLRCAYLSKPFAASALVSKIEAQVKGSQPKPPMALDEMMAVAQAGGAKKRSEPAPPPVGGPEQRVDLVSLRVVVLLAGYQVEGNVHCPPELGRFSDAWEAMMKDPRRFLPMTDTIITVHGGPKAVAEAGFVSIRKDDIQGVFPKEG